MKKGTSRKPKYVVQIMKAHKRTYWYALHKGQLFIVDDDPLYKDQYGILSKHKRDNKFYFGQGYLQKKDCRIIYKLN